MINNQLQVRETKVNYNELIELAFKKQNWGKKYTLYTFGKTSINCLMREFDFSNNSAMFKIEVNYFINKKAITDYSLVYYHIKNYTFKEFEDLIKRRVITLINEQIEKETKYKAYNKFKDLRVYVNCDNIEVLSKKYSLFSDLEEIRKISNDDIQGECLKVFEEKITELANEIYKEEVEDYVEHNKVTLNNLEKIKINVKNSLQKGVK